MLCRAAPCTRRSRSRSNVDVKSGLSVGWRGGSGCGGRRKYVPVASIAPSMALTPPQPEPPRLRQVPAICRDCILHCCWWVSTLVDTCLACGGRLLFVVGDDRWSSSEQAQRSDPLLLFFLSSVAGRPRKLSEAGRGGLRRGVSRMDAATELTGVKALCLRSTASQAPERTAASGWAGPRRGTCSVPCAAHPARPSKASAFNKPSHEGLSRSRPTQHPARAGDLPSRHRSSARDGAAPSSTPVP